MLRERTIRIRFVVDSATGMYRVVPPPQMEKNPFFVEKKIDFVQAGFGKYVSEKVDIIANSLQMMPFGGNLIYTRRFPLPCDFIRSPIPTIPTIFVCDWHNSSQSLQALLFRQINNRCTAGHDPKSQFTP